MRGNLQFFETPMTPLGIATIIEAGKQRSREGDENKLP